MTQEPPASTPAEPFSYTGSAGCFDEMEEAPGRVRPHWRSFADSLARLGRDELISRSEDGRRLIREHGVTYSIYGDPKGMDRPWGLDLVPLLITAEEWARLEAGLIQRSRLLNRILADVYGGSQRLLRDGFIPPQLIYANPAFLRPCRGIQIRDGIYLHLHACDLGRSPDGQWWVLSDRTQAPGGLGYAWENRTVLARLLPEEIRDRNVQPVASFFRHQREMLLDLAPPGRPHPSVVFLTPGPHNEIYFEHAYLARHLGFPLVEGADLTVRGRRVFLKTVEGLEPVDIILRRVADGYCDPLELRSDSFLGVAGLLDAARAGQVTIANALGSGLMESPAFLPFLPNLCRHLLDEDLLLPSVVAQERLQVSRAPAWENGQLSPRPVVVRAFIAQGAGSTIVLPGGLTRISTTFDELSLSLQGSGGSKDTWILANGTPPPSDLAPLHAQRRPAEHALRGVPSRAADHLFWLGRYTERLEQLLRILRGVLGRISAEAGREDSEQSQALCQLAVNLGLLGSSTAPLLPKQLSARILRLLYSPEEPGGARDLLARIRLTASAVRDRFSGDTWRILGRLETDAQTTPGRLPVASATALIHNLVLDLAAFNGMEMENMTRGGGWRFLDFGRRLERAASVVQLLRAAVTEQAPSALVLEPVLDIADSVMTYRRMFYDQPRLPGVIAVLLRDDSNPRSLAFQLRILAEHASALAQTAKTASPTPGEPLRIPVLDHPLVSDEEADERAHALTAGLRRRLEAWAADLAALSDQVTNRYFSHSVPRSS